MKHGESDNNGFIEVDGQKKYLLRLIHNRRSIRKFSDRPVSDSTLKEIIEAGIRAPGGSHMYSIVYTRDLEKIKKMKTIGFYPTTKVLIIFLIDIRKLEKIVEHQGYTYNFDDGVAIWLGIQKVSLAIENLTLAAEASGLGSVLIGSPPRQADLIAEVFAIPRRVFPVVGMCLGYPDTSEKTQPRPRFPQKFCAYADSYRDLTTDEIHEGVRVMNDGYLSQGYYKKIIGEIPSCREKSGSNRYSWAEHISRMYSKRGNREESLFSIIKRCGFTLD